MRAELGALLVAALVVAGCSTAAPATPPPTVTSSATPAAAAGPQPLPTAPEVRPVHLRIPAIAVDAPALVPLGLGPDHQLEAPAKFEDVGWYAGRPGAG